MADTKVRGDGARGDKCSTIKKSSYVEGKEKSVEQLQAINFLIEIWRVESERERERRRRAVVKRSEAHCPNKYRQSDNGANALLSIKHVQNGIDKLCAYEISENLLCI